jgi:hypothetical protein
MVMNRMSLAAAALVALTVLTGCVADTEDDAVPADTTAMAGDTVQDELPVEPIVSGLDDVNDSGISGEATATHSQQEVTVSILLKEGAQPDVSYAAHIHTGTCEEGGPVAVDIGPVQNLQSSKTLQLSELPADQPAFIQVHGPDGQPVACGDMKGHEGDRERPDTTTGSGTGD